MYGLVWSYMALYSWLCIVLFGLVWPFMALYGLACYCKFLSSLVQSDMALYVLVSSDMVLHGLMIDNANISPS